MGIRLGERGEASFFAPFSLSALVSFFLCIQVILSFLRLCEAYLSATEGTASSLVMAIGKFKAILTLLTNSSILVLSYLILSSWYSQKGGSMIWSILYRYIATL